MNTATNNAARFDLTTIDGLNAMLDATQGERDLLAYAWMTEVIDDVSTIEEAEALLPLVRAQDGCLGARVIGGHGFVGTLRVGKNPAVQSFFADMGEGAALPDGWHRRMVPTAVLASCAA